MTASLPLKLRLSWRTLSHIFPSSHYALVSLLFVFGLEVIYGFHHWILLLVSILFAAVAIGIIIIRSEEGPHFHPTQIILPILAVAGLLGYSLFLTANIWLHLFFILAGFFLFFLLKHGARSAYPTWNWILSHVVLFLNLAVIFGWRYHLYIPILAVLTAGLFIIFFISLQSLQRLSPSLLDASLLSLAISFVLTQVTWLLLFLPLHFIVQAGIIVVLYYTIFHIVSNLYEHGWQRRSIIEYMAIGGGGLLLVLFTAQWF